MLRHLFYCTHASVFQVLLQCANCCRQRDHQLHRQVLCIITRRTRHHITYTVLHVPTSHCLSPSSSSAPDLTIVTVGQLATFVVVARDSFGNTLPFDAPALPRCRLRHVLLELSLTRAQRNLLAEPRQADGQIIGRAGKLCDGVNLAMSVGAHEEIDQGFAANDDAWGLGLRHRHYYRPF